MTSRLHSLSARRAAPFAVAVLVVLVAVVATFLTPLVAAVSALAAVGLALVARPARAEPRRRLDQQIESATAEVRSILETAPAPIVVVDGRGCILRVNWAVTTVFGWEPEQLIGQSIGLLGGSPEGGERLALLQHVLGTGREGRHRGTTETVARTRDGTALTIELSVAEMQNVAEMGGEGAGRYICVLHDVTEQRRSHEQLLIARKNEALGTLVSGVARDFNNLLTLIAGNLELAREAAEIDPHWIETASYATDNAIDLVKQLLLFSRREEPSMAPVDISQLVEDTVELMRTTIDRRIEVRVFAPDTLPAVEGDRGQLQQALMNLLMNARDSVLARLESAAVRPDYSPYIAISVVLGEAEDARGVTRPCVAMAVEDNGMGMTPKVRERVFDPFFTTKGVGEGAGLGLSTTYGIVTEHNGTLSVESQFGDGATFNVVLPTMEEQAAAAEQPEQPAAGRETPPRRASVLLVDDDERIVTMTGLMLTRAGFEVTTATGGNGALAAVAERDFDLVVLDVNMPAPDGWATLDALLEQRPNVRVLMASGFASEAEAVEHGAVGLIDKPFHSKALIEAVERSLAA